MEIKLKHILASSGYPTYGFPWIKVEGENISGGISDGDGIYAWDGSLLSNTPVREVLNVSPRNDKNIFIVENYPRKVRRLLLIWQKSKVEPQRPSKYSDHV